MKLELVCIAKCHAVEQGGKADSKVNSQHSMLQCGDLGGILPRILYKNSCDYNGFKRKIIWKEN